LGMYETLKKATAIGVLAASLTGLAGIVKAQDKKFEPVQVDTFQVTYPFSHNNMDDLVVIASFQIDEKNHVGIFPMMVGVGYYKSTNDGTPSRAKKLDTLYINSDQCLGTTIKNLDDRPGKDLGIFVTDCKNPKVEKKYIGIYSNKNDDGNLEKIK
jgi:hypothetical protein